MERDIYKLYKPLRNHLRSLSVQNAFYVIWAYSNFLQFKNPFPKDIQVEKSFIDAKHHTERGLYEWELALLARESIVNSTTDIGFATKTLQSWSYFSRAINKLKEFENNIWPTAGKAEKVLKEMSRVARRQFPWQSRPNSTSFLRYYKIYSNPRTARIIEKRIGMSLEKWYTIGCVAYGSFITNPKMDVDPLINLENITITDFETVFSYISNSIDGIKGHVKSNVHYDDRFAYSFNPLELFPMIKIDEYYFCPIPTLLAWRITSGIYFDLIKDRNDGDNFGSEFGFAFQDYLIEVARKVIDSKQIKVIGEEKYKRGKDIKDSVDIIISDTESAFFVESKTKRLTMRSKSELMTDDAIDGDIKILAEAVVQVYRTIQDYEAGYYSHFPYEQHLRIFPIVVTLEDWYLLGQDQENLHKQVIALMKEKGIPESYITKMPYTICSCFHYELLMQLLDKFSIKEIMDGWFVIEKRGHNFGNDLILRYKDAGLKSMDDYFPGDFENIFPPSVMLDHTTAN